MDFVVKDDSIVSKLSFVDNGIEIHYNSEKKDNFINYHQLCNSYITLIPKVYEHRGIIALSFEKIQICIETLSNKKISVETKINDRQIFKMIKNIHLFQNFKIFVSENKNNDGLYSIYLHELDTLLKINFVLKENLPLLTNSEIRNIEINSLFSLIITLAFSYLLFNDFSMYNFHLSYLILPFIVFLIPSCTLIKLEWKKYKLRKLLNL